MQEKIPLIIIKGQTASGKSALAARLMELFPSNLVNGDAQQIYRGLQVVTAAPRELDGTFLFCFKEINEQYSFAEYTHDADTAIAKISTQLHRTPIVVGGSGLYLDALVHRPITPPKVLDEIRTRAKAMTDEEAREFLFLHDPAGAAAIDMRNPRRVQRAVEIILQTGSSITEFRQHTESPYDVLQIGWSVNPDELKRRIVTRVDQMWQEGAVDEVRAALAAGHALDEPGMRAIGVLEIAGFLAGEYDEVYARELIVVHTLQYAKRQQTWFKKDVGTIWYTNFDDVWHSVQNFLQKHSLQS